jgi:hypothetical protein
MPAKPFIYDGYKWNPLDDLTIDFHISSPPNKGVTVIPKVKLINNGKYNLSQKKK